MPRVKRGTIKTKRRRNILSMTKGMRHGRKSKLRLAREAIFQVAKHAFAHRRDKKAVFRQQWHITISTALQEQGISFSQFLGKLRKTNSQLNKKMLAQLSKEEPQIFKAIVESVK
jgi:large subunit ribosomal protein L20